MENQPVANTSDPPSADAVQVNQSPISPQTKANLTMPVLITFLVSSVLFGLGGYYFGKQSSDPQPNNYIPSLSTPTPIADSTASPMVAQSDSSLKTYTNQHLGIRFILQDKNASQSLEQFYTQIGGADLTKAQKTTIDGHSALLFEGEGIGLIHTTYIDLGEDAFEIFGNAIVDDQKSMNVYREIVKTFKISR